MKISKSVYELDLITTKNIKLKYFKELCTHIIEVLSSNTKNAIKNRCNDSTKKFFGISKCTLCEFREYKYRKKEKDFHRRGKNFEEFPNLSEEKPCDWMKEFKIYKLGKEKFKQYNSCHDCFCDKTDYNFSKEIKCSDINLNLALVHGTYDIAFLWKLPDNYWGGMNRFGINLLYGISDILPIPCHRVESDNAPINFNGYVDFDKDKIITFTLISPKNKENGNTFDENFHELIKKLLIYRDKNMRNKNGKNKIEVFLTYIKYFPIIVKHQFDDDQEAHDMLLSMIKRYKEMGETSTTYSHSIFPKIDKKDKKVKLDIDSWLKIELRKLEAKKVLIKQPYTIGLKFLSLHKNFKVNNITRKIDKKIEKEGIKNYVNLLSKGSGRNETKYIFHSTGYWDIFIPIQSASSKLLMSFVAKHVRTMSGIKQCITIPQYSEINVRRELYGK